MSRVGDGAAAALGKIAPGAFEKLIAPHLGAHRPEVLVGPRPGHDCAIVRIGAGRVMALTTDPLSVIPCLGLERSARLACHLLASDLWTSGIPPAFAAIELDLPASFDDDALEKYWRAMSDEWDRLGVAVVTGHTGRYGRSGDDTILGGGTLMGLGDEGRYVTPGMARPGDRVIVTKGCAIEATAVAAHLVPRRLARLLDAEGMARARAFVEQVSVVADCRAILRIGVSDQGVTALHDATEGGVLGGLVEMAHACGHDLRVEQSRIPLAPETVAACEALGGIDPWWSLSEGTLIACVRPTRTSAALAELASEGIAAAEVGEVMEGSGRLWLTASGGRVSTIDAPEPDPYWGAYTRAVREGWE